MSASVMRGNSFIFRWLAGKTIPTDNKISVSAICISALFSLWVSFTGGIINLDGIVYLSLAERLGQGDFVGAAKLYNWLFYPLLIAGLSKLTTLSLDTSAYLLTAFFSALLTYAFLGCVRLLGGTKQILLWAAFIIVIHPVFMEARSDILRDHGYWSFYLLSVLFFLHFYKNPGWSYAFCWGISMVLATLFRIEGLLFLLLLPTVLLFKSGISWPARVYCFGQAHLVNILIILLVAGYNIYDPHVCLLDYGRLGDPFLLWQKFHAVLNGGLIWKAEVLEKILQPYSEDYAMPVLIMIPFIILADKLFSTVIPMYALALSWHPFRYVKSLQKKFLPVLAWLVILNLGMLIVFLFVDFFIQKRVVFPLGIILLLPLPFILNTHFEKWKFLQQTSRKIRWLLFPVLITFLFYIADGLFTFPGYSQYFIKDAGLWLRDNIPAQASMYTNNPKIYFYSEHMAGYWEERPSRKKLSREFLQMVPWQGREYIALWANHKSKLTISEISAEIGSSPLKIFKNIRNDRVIIYTAR